MTLLFTYQSDFIWPVLPPVTGGIPNPIRAVAGQHSSPELSFANKTKMLFRAKYKRNHWTVKYRSL